MVWDLACKTVETGEGAVDTRDKEKEREELEKYPISESPGEFECISHKSRQSVAQSKTQSSVQSAVPAACGKTRLYLHFIPHGVSYMLF